VPIVDLTIVALTLAVAVWGYRQGVTTAALVLVGFGVGAVLGSSLAPLVLDDGLRDPYAPALAGPAGLLCGALLAAALERVGFVLRESLDERGRLDALGGGLLAGLVGLMFVWIVAALVVRADILRASIGDSAVVDALNAVVVPPAPLLASGASDPLSGLSGPAANGPPAGLNVERDPEVRAAKASVVKFATVSCGKGGGGSGWVAADGIVVTNAHVVEGADLTAVQVEGKGKHHPAEPIWYDKLNDIAVVRSPGVRGAPALPIDVKPEPGTAAAILGFPGNGAYEVKRARLGVTSTPPGFKVEDGLRGRRLVTRMIARATPGNSGGPVVDLDGRVVGVTFASETGGYNSYAVPTTTVARALRRAGPPVDTGPCL
jgi:hypothetical protein